MKHIILLALLVPASAEAQQQMEYRVKQDYESIVRAVERVMNEPRERPVQIPNLPAIVGASDLVQATTSINPKQRKYSATVEYAVGKLHLCHRIDLSWTRTDYRIVAFVDIDWCWNARIGRRIVQRVVSKAECTFLCLERNKILELSRRIDTVEVEKPDSWVYIISDAIDVGVRTYQKFKELKDAARKDR